MRVLCAGHALKAKAQIASAAAIQHQDGGSAHDKDEINRKSLGKRMRKEVVLFILSERAAQGQQRDAANAAEHREDAARRPSFSAG